MSLLELLQAVGTAVGIYVAVRVDIATMKIRLDHLERDRYQEKTALT